MSSMIMIAAVALATSGRAAEDGSKPADLSKPVKVFILMGQSNMVGAGKFSGGSARWGKEFIAPVVSVYPGAYDPKAVYMDVGEAMGKAMVELLKK